MSFIRHYLMIAGSGQIENLHSALNALAARIAPLAGTLGTELYQDADKPERFVFLERWDSPESQKAAGAALGKEVFGPIMAALASPPEAASLTPL